MDLVNCELRDIWSHVQAQPPETTIQDLAQAYVEWELHHKNNRRLQRKLLLHAIVLAIDSDTLINNPMTSLVSRQIGFMMRRLRDELLETRQGVTFASFRGLGPGSDQRALAWANSTLLAVLETLDDIEAADG